MIDIHALVERVMTLEPDDRAHHSAIRCVVDWAGCALAGSTHRAATAVAAATGAIGHGDRCTLVGRNERAAEYTAALVNGTASHVLDFDDVNVTMIGHPAVVVMPAALAAAEASGASGPEMLGAVVVGYEIAEALGAAVNPAHYEQGWHATATLGCVAATGAVAKVLGLDVATSARAVSLATTQAGGVRAMFGTHGKSFHAGRAAASGILSAHLAGAGLEVPEDVWVGPAGYLYASGWVPDPSSAQSGTGDGQGSGANVTAVRDTRRQAAIHRTAFKGHAACGATHCAIDAVASLVADYQLAASDIAAIELEVHPLAVQAAGIAQPATGLEGKFSLRHTAAQAVLAYPLLPSCFTDEAVTDPLVGALRDRVRVSVDKSFSYDEAMPARTRVTTTDGRSYERYVDVPRGRPGNPMTDDELSAKFLALAEPVLGAGRARDSLAALWKVGDVRDVAETTRQLAR